MSCHDYEGVMLALCTPHQLKCYQGYWQFILSSSFDSICDNVDYHKAIFNSYQIFN